MPMPASRRLAAAALALLAVTATGCKKGATEADDPDVSATTQSTPRASVAVASHDSPDGAMAGLLDAMRAGDNDAVLSWISPDPEADRNSVTQTEKLRTTLGLSGSLFWEVDERHVTGVTPHGDDAADVALDGYLVWCTGDGPDDAQASCAQPNGSGDTQTTTYPAVRVEGQWYVHLDLNHGQLIHGNPGKAGVAG
jgi:hypothetical protein